MRLKYLGFILVIGILVSSCKKNEAVGLFTTTDLNDLTVDYIDTFTVNTSTVKMDSLPTFGSLNNNTFLIGNYQDPVMGTVSAQPYFQVGLPSDAQSSNGFDLSQYKFLGIKFDSMRFVMYYNSAPIESPASNGSTTSPSLGTYYPYIGDTLLRQTYTLYRMTENFTLFKLLNTNTPGSLIPYFYNSTTNSAAAPGVYQTNAGNETGYLFNTSKFNYDASNPLGTVEFMPRPRSKTFRAKRDANGKALGSLNDSIVFKMSEELGKTFLDMAVNSAFAFRNGSTGVVNGNFLDFFKGLTIVSNSTGNILSFDPSHAYMRLYYEKSDAGTFQPTFADFPVLAPTKNANYPALFNHIQADYTGTPMQGVQPFVEIPSAKTDHQTYVQAGTGLMTRIEIPYLNNFLATHPTVSINRAELILQTMPNLRTSIYPTPPFLWLYRTDASNIPLAPLNQDFNPSATQTSLYYSNYPSTPVGFYKFFVVQFTGELLNATSYNGSALLIGPSPLAMDNSVERVILGDRTRPANKPILRIYYSKLGNN